MVDQDLQEVEMEIEVEEEEIKCSVFDNDPLAVRWRVFLLVAFVDNGVNAEGAEVAESAELDFIDIPFKSIHKSDSIKIYKIT